MAEKQKQDDEFELSRADEDAADYVEPLEDTEEETEEDPEEVASKEAHADASTNEPDVSFAREV